LRRLLLPRPSSLSSSFLDLDFSLDRTPKAKGALAGCVLTALLGMITVVWVRPRSLSLDGSRTSSLTLAPLARPQYAFGGELDAEELKEEVLHDMAAKKAAGGGLIKRGLKAVTGKKAGASA